MAARHDLVTNRPVRLHVVSGVPRAVAERQSNQKRGNVADPRRSRPGTNSSIVDRSARAFAAAGSACMAAAVCLALAWSTAPRGSPAWAQAGAGPAAGAPAPVPRSPEAAAAPTPDATKAPAPPAAAAGAAADATKGPVPAAPAQAAATTPPAATPPATAASAPETAPAAATPLSAEAQYMAALDALIAPVRDAMPEAEDAQRVKDALKALREHNPAASAALRAEIRDPAARKLVQWLALKGGYGDASEYRQFLDENPTWPEHRLLTRRGEEQLLNAGGSAQSIRDFFKGREPRTGAGLAALASAHLASGETEVATQLARRAWRQHDLPALLETGFIERFRALLTPEDHRRRLDRLLIDSIRSTAERNERAAIARRVIPLLQEGERAKAEARLAMFLNAKQAAQLLAALPAEPDGQTDWGLAFQRVQHFRRLGQHEAVWKILTSAPTDPQSVINADDWWEERRAAAQVALKAGKHEIAYDLVKEAGPLSVNEARDQTFMAGWIAMRVLEKADLALPHFVKSREVSDGPLGQSRAAYWAGRALEALGRTEEAKQKYADAAKQADTFHGQLARHRVDARPSVEWAVTMPAKPTQPEADRFVQLDSVRAAVLATKMGLDPNIRRALFGQLRNTLASEAELAMLAHLAFALGDPQTGLRAGKTAIARGFNLIAYAYPLHPFPEYTPLREPPEPAMLLAVARQETEFNNTIVSTAGARGLLQVMPITAQHVCRDYHIRCDIPRLLTDNAYNAQIASAYIADRMAELGGSYVLGLAAYNAGPGRARQWIREIGDPRDPSVDPIDWIEQIPIQETRDYVKKVLSNIQVYRARLGEPQALRLEPDLRRLADRKRVKAEAE